VADETIPAGKGHKGRSTHRRILQSGSQLIRNRGLAGATIADVMRGADLTVGGFYAHFRSKEQMDGELLTRDFERSVDHWFSGLARRPNRETYVRAVKRYLSADHRDSRSDGCPLPFVISEVPNAGPRVRQTVRAAVARYIEELEARCPRSRPIRPRDEAIATLALCVGGLALSRAMSGTPAADDILVACRNRVTPSSNPPSSRSETSSRNG
jgi:TetR/AcrR family transcriptional regulator, transcriptional repressor for nem operon